MTTATPARPSLIEAVRRKKPGQGMFARKMETVEDRVAETFAPPEVHLVTARTREKIVATRWQDDLGRWLYVHEIPALGKRAAGGQPPLFAVFSDNPAWDSNAPVREKMERRLIDRFMAPWSGFEAAQLALDQYASHKGWTPDPPLPVDDEEAKPTRSNGANHKVHDGHDAAAIAEKSEHAGESQISDPRLEPAMISRNRSSKRSPAKPQAPSPKPQDLFSHERTGIWEAAEKWLHDHSVPKSEWPAWLLVLPDQEQVTITHDNWAVWVEALLKPWKKSGYELAQVDDDYVLVGTCEGLRLGVVLQPDGIALHETAVNDEFFRQKLSDTGFLNLAGLDAKRTTPASLALRVRREMAAFQKRCEAEKRRKAKPSAKTQDRRPKPRRKARFAARSQRLPPSPKKARTPAASPMSAGGPASIGSGSLAMVPAPSLATDHPPLATSAPITAAEKSSLKSCEKIIERNRTAFVEMGKALAEIRDRRLYREHHATWEAYLRDRWGFGRAEAADKIAAARVAAIVSPAGNKANLPLIEDHLKALASVESAKDVEAIWQRVQKRSAKEGVPVTGRLLRQERHAYETPADDLAAEKRRAGEEETRRKPLDMKEALREAWNAQLEEVKAHVQAVAEKWHFPQCRKALALLLLNLQRELEAQL